MGSFQGRGGGGTVVMIVEYYIVNRRPEVGPGNLSHPANFEIFNKKFLCRLVHFG